jgi:hypothetical protein
MKSFENRPRQSFIHTYSYLPICSPSGGNARYTLAPDHHRHAHAQTSPFLLVVLSIERREMKVHESVSSFFLSFAFFSVPVLPHLVCTETCSPPDNVTYLVRRGRKASLCVGNS